MPTKLETFTPVIIEEMNRSLSEVQEADVGAIREYDNKYWSISLLYGKLEGQKHSTYAIKVTSNLGDHESEIYPYSDFVGDNAEQVRQDMDNWGTCNLGIFEEMRSYAEYLKINDIITKTDNMDAQLAGGDSDVQPYEDMIRDFVQNNTESIAKKSQTDFDGETLDGAWLDTPMQIQKYGGIVLALVNKKVDDILGITDTAKLGSIKSRMVKDGFLIYKKPQDITLIKGHEVKCSVFRLAPDMLPEKEA